MTRAELRLTLVNDLGELPAVTERADAFLLAHGRGEETRYTVRLVLEELLSNVIRHGYEDGAPHEIAVALGVSAGAVALELVDDARAFDPLSAPAFDVEMPLAERRAGGMGIHLVRSMTREVRYRRIDGRNHIDVRI
jgi:serine/threonine-protein kinase RsbW